MRSSLVRRLLLLLIGAALLWAASGLVARRVADHLMFRNNPPTYAIQGNVRLIDSGDGERIALAYLPNPTARFTILFFHGSGSQLGKDMTFLEDLRHAGFAVAAIDYRGYGASEGTASARAVSADARAAMHWLGGTQGTAASQVIVLGHSLGSGPAVQVAAEYPIAGLIIEAGFASAFSVKTELGARLLAPFDVFPNARLLREVKCPKLIIHGTEDSAIPLAHGLRLYTAAREPKHLVLVPGGNHHIVASMGSAFWRELQQFAAGLPH